MKRYMGIAMSAIAGVMLLALPSFAWKTTLSTYGGYKAPTSTITPTTKSRLLMGGFMAYNGIYSCASSADGTYAGTVYKQTSSGTKYDAVYWSKLGATGVILTPTGYTNAYADWIDSGKEVGAVVSADGIWHAALWSNTAASFLNLDPTATDGNGNLLWTKSEATYMKDGWQVGKVQNSSQTLAAVWNGSADTFEALSVAGYSTTGAYYDYVANDTIYVVGYATDAVTGNRTDVVWSKSLTAEEEPVPEPSSLLALAALAPLAGFAVRRRK